MFSAIAGFLAFASAIVGAVVVGIGCLAGALFIGSLVVEIIAGACSIGGVLLFGTAAGGSIIAEVVMAVIIAGFSLGVVTIPISGAVGIAEMITGLFTLVSGAGALLSLVVIAYALTLGWIIPLISLVATPLLIGLGFLVGCCGTSATILGFGLACASEGCCVGFSLATACNFLCPCTIPLTFCSVFGTLSCNIWAVVCTPLFCFSWGCLAFGMPALCFEVTCGTICCPCPLISLPIWCIGIPFKLCCLSTGFVSTCLSMVASCGLYSCLGCSGILGFLGFTFCSSLGVMASGTALALCFLSAGSCIGILSTCTATAVSIPCCACMASGGMATGLTAIVCCVPSTICSFMGITGLGTTLTLGGAFTMFFTQYCSPYLQPYIDYCLPSCVACYGTGFDLMSYPVSCFGSLCGPISGLVAVVPGIATCLGAIGLAGLCPLIPVPPVP